MAGKHVMLKTVPVGELYLTSSLAKGEIRKVVAHNYQENVTCVEDQYGHLTWRDSESLVYVD